MKRLALIFSLSIIITSLCSCQKYKEFKNWASPPVEDGGEMIYSVKESETDENSLSSSDTESGSADTENDPQDVPKGLGCAGTLVGRTVVMSVFADDPTLVTQPWSESEEDVGLKKTMLRCLGIACEWISEQAYEFDIKSEFIYDWSLHDDLKKAVTFRNYDMLVDDDSLYELIAKEVTNHIDADTLLDKYDADNIVYLFFYNTTSENEMLPVTLSHVNSRDFDVEYSTIPTLTNNNLTSPSILAHELLHFFGAYDLYEFEGNPIPAEYLAHHAETDPNDIMTTVELGENIPNTLSLIDAYYTGLIDNCDDVAEFELPVAERFLDK